MWLAKVLQKMAKVKVCNPLFMMNEVDKMSMDFRGDPSSALLGITIALKSSFIFSTESSFAINVTLFVIVIFLSFK